MCRFICAASVILLLLACDSDRSTNSPQVLNYPVESADAALFYGEELYAPTNLTYQIDRELTLIREQWSDSIPIVGTTFRLPWPRSSVSVGVDTAYVDSFLLGDWQPWAALREKYSLSFAPSFSWGDHTWAGVSSSVLLHSELMVDLLAGLPGFQVVYTSPLGHPYGPIVVRIELDRTVHYFFETDACPDIFQRYDHFTVDNRRARYQGTHWECPPNFDSICQSIGSIECWKYMEAWADSARANQPAWLDTAGIAIRHWSWESGASWQREP